jgi:hypothetical protein
MARSVSVGQYFLLLEVLGGFGLVCKFEEVLLGFSREPMANLAV